MTLCIAAIGQESSEARIVLGFDHKISGLEFGSETEFKFQPLGPQLVSLFADSAARARELAGIYKPYLKTIILDKYSIVDQLRQPIATLKDRLANAYLGRCFGISYEDFKHHGIDWFGAKEHAKRLSAISQHPLRVQFIIAGFIGYLPIICELKDGEILQRTTTSLIGSGAYTAEPQLHARGQSEDTDLAATLYNVYEAKKTGESSPHVGKMTTMLVLYPSEENKTRVSLVTEDGMSYLDRLYGIYGPKPWESGKHQLPSNSLQPVPLPY